MKQVVHARLQRYWDIRAAGNFSFGGSGSGLVLAAALGFLIGVPSARCLPSPRSRDTIQRPLAWRQSAPSARTASMMASAKE